MCFIAKEKSHSENKIYMCFYIYIYYNLENSNKIKYF